MFYPDSVKVTTPSDRSRLEELLSTLQPWGGVVTALRWQRMKRAPGDGLRDLLPGQRQWETESPSSPQLQAAAIQLSASQ